MAGKESSNGNGNEETGTDFKNMKVGQDASDPLAGERIARDHSTPTQDFEGTAPEPSAGSGGNGETGGGAAPEGGGPKPPGDDFEPVAKMESAEDLADELIDGYIEYKPQLFRMMASSPISEKKMDKMAANGEVNFNMMFNKPDGTPTSVLAFFRNIYMDIDSKFKPPVNFKEKIKPPLVKELSKRGWGVSPMQQILIIVGKDLAASGLQAVSIIKQIHESLEFFKQQTAANKNGNTAPAPEQGEDTAAPKNQNSSAGSADNIQDVHFEEVANPAT